MVSESSESSGPPIDPEDPMRDYLLQQRREKKEKRKKDSKTKTKTKKKSKHSDETPEERRLRKELKRAKKAAKKREDIDVVHKSGHSSFPYGNSRRKESFASEQYERDYRS